MKIRRFLLSALTVLSCVASGYAQNIKDVEVKELTMELRDGYINVDMDLDMSNLRVKGTQVVVLTPCIINGNDSLMLKSIGIYGRNRRIFYQRNIDVKPTGGRDRDLAPSELDNIIEYKESVGFLQWMDGCRLTVLRTDYGCCDGADLVCSTDLVEKFPLDPYLPELIYIRPEHEMDKTREISGTAYIDFPVSRIDIDPEYRNNIMELSKIIGTIDSVKRDEDITIRSLSIKGFASPESPYSNNTYLAKGRTAALKTYVQGLYHFEDGFIKTSYEPEDWDGLEKYVMASDLTNKEKILEVIRSDREPDAKEWVIKSTWKNEYKYLLEHCYPALRRSDYRIEYTIRAYTDTLEIENIFRTAPQKLSLEEFYILAQSYDPGSEDFNELFETAVRMYPNDPVANLNAANSAIIKKDYRRALRYLDKAEGLPEAVYARGALEVYMEDNAAARPYLEQARKLGIRQAETTLSEISKNRMIYKMTNNKQ